MKNLKRYWRQLLRFRAVGLSLLVLTPSVVALAAYENPTPALADDCSRLFAGCQVYESDSEVVLDATLTPLASINLTDYASFATYQVVFQGELEATTDTAEFIAQVAQTLGDARGWAQAGYTFSRVQQAGDADFKLTLIQAELLDEIPGCSSDYSCRVGANVYINEDRWNGTTPAWNSAGGSLRDYRHMVVNHEVGHWLGLGHYNCSDSPSNLAPVMQQQSIDLQGCQFNPWPLAFEIALV